MDSGSGDGGSGFPTTDDFESLISTTDAELMKRAWRNEKGAPEILQFEAALVQRSREQIQLMEETVEDYTKSGVDPLTVSLYQMDLDRTMFLLRSYLRTRLQKIEKYVFHIQRSDEFWNRLSKQEQEFAQRCAEDLQTHFEQSVLSKLPPGFKSHLKQSSVSEQDDMGRSKRFLGAFQLDDSGEDPVSIEADDLYALPYKSVKPLVENGQIDIV
nr:DNA replication complex GINS protein SLD5-like [Ipomoea trifida]